MNRIMNKSRWTNMTLVFSALSVMTALVACGTDRNAANRTSIDVAGLTARSGDPDILKVERTEDGGSYEITAYVEYQGQQRTFAMRPSQRDSDLKIQPLSSDLTLQTEALCEDAQCTGFVVVARAQQSYYGRVTNSVLIRRDTYSGRYIPITTSATNFLTAVEALRQLQGQGYGNIYDPRYIW